MLNGRVISMAMVLALGGMASGVAVAQAPVSSIVMERSPCFGACPVYEVALNDNGAVRFDGKRFVAQLGPHAGTVSPQAFHSLVAMLDATDFFHLRDRYRLKEDGCTATLPDHPTVHITVKRGTETKRVSYYYGCRGLPVGETIDTLSKAIDSAADTQQWVGKGRQSVSD